MNFVLLRENPLFPAKSGVKPATGCFLSSNQRHEFRFAERKSTISGQIRSKASDGLLSE